MTEREAQLMQQGWQRRFCAAEPRLSEMAAIYEETGFEVHLEPLAAVEATDKDRDECAGCMICYQGVEDRYQVIYTRPKMQRKKRREKGDRRRKGLT
jgi:transposase